jgi:hypothetical protein
MTKFQSRIVMHKWIIEFFKSAKSQKSLLMRMIFYEFFRFFIFGLFFTTIMYASSFFYTGAKSIVSREYSVMPLTILSLFGFLRAIWIFIGKGMGRP